jgi:phage shock protein PspC (stress-responsive transcriptional regulator)
MEQTTDTNTDVPADSTFVPPVTPPIAPATETRPKFRLRRSSTDRMLGGVCGGLAESLDIDPALLRIAMVALTVIGVGATIPVYAAIWLLAPETDTP